jgi:KUP system potassium uptake protein
VLGRETLVVRGGRGLARWQGRLFALLSRNAQRPTLHFHVPPNRVIEIGAQLEL